MPTLAWEHGEPSQEEKDRIAALYFGEVTLVDRWIGRLLETIDDLKLWDDTVVAFTADHGVKLFDNDGRCGKSARDPRPYNSRIPLFIRHPDGPRGKIVNHFAQAHDLAPTLMKMAGVPFEVDGSDIWPMAVEDAPPVRDHAIIAWGNFSRGRATGFVSARDDDWNYTVSTGNDGGNPRLYDLNNDPEEVTNVVDQHPKVVELQRERIEKVLGQPLPGDHNEVCGAASSPFDICTKNWFKGTVGPPTPE